MGYSQFPDEAEVLLSPNVKFIATGDGALHDDGYYYVNLVEINEEGSFVF